MRKKEEEAQKRLKSEVAYQMQEYGGRIAELQAAVNQLQAEKQATKKAVAKAPVKKGKK